jgi:flagellar motor switch protein FliN/FliY
MMDNLGKKQAAQVFAAAFAESLAASVTGAIGSPWPLAVVESPDPPTNKEKPIHFRLTVSGALHGECFVSFYEPQLSNLMAKMQEQQVEAPAEEPGEALATVIASAMTGLARSLKDSFGTLVFKVDRVAGLAFGGMFVVPLAASGDPAGAPVLLYFDGQLLDALSAPDGKQRAEVEKREIDPHNLKLVMDVELNVSLRFGQRQLALREVLDLASGSVIELDRMVDEPVDLYLDGKLIARGEAVIVDGNYGLRVTEIPQPVASHLLR